MQYRWDDFNLDRKGTLLTREGQQVDVSRKILDCISHLIEQRHRVVGYDELIQKVWGHGNVSNHRLTQLIVAARRAVGDDGQTQAAIRTMPGMGYRWVLPVTEGLEAPAPPATPTMTAPGERLDESPQTRIPHPSEPVRGAKHSGRRGVRMAAALLLGTVAAGVAYRYISVQEPAPSVGSPSGTIAVAAPTDPIDALRQSLRMGKHEDVRDGLAKLPAALADTPDTRILEIELDIDLGRFDRAEQKLAVQLARAEAAEDTFWQVRLLTIQSYARAQAGQQASEVLPSAKLAVELLESTGTSASTQAMGLALSARGNGFLIDNDLERATQDLVRARDILRKAGDERGAAEAQRYLAHVWLRTGRMTDALEQMVAVADTFGRFGDPVNEIGVRNMATRIQIEQLRWDEALAGSERCLQAARKVPDSRRRIGALKLRALVLTSTGRLREAGSYLEEAGAIAEERTFSAITAAHALASDRPELALAEAAVAFDFYGANDRLSLVLENQEGALLRWMIAAQTLAARGQTMPSLSPAQVTALQNPASSIGRIARGRWLWSQGQLQAAETEFRLALAKPRAQGWLSELLYVNEALIELLLQRGNAAAAERALTDMWGSDPDRLSRDYRANLLGLRVALASGDDATVASAFLATKALAGERVLPLDVAKAYAQRVQRATQTRIADAAATTHAP
jgi:DNA-binding winged helix-turn-helix (wHTH) protein/tetratricopeptide (TPR) repeat protein